MKGMVVNMRYQKSVYRALALISQFGINMLVPIFLCSFVGMYIDRSMGTSYWMILLFFIGALAGFRNVYIFARRIYNDKDSKGDGNRRRRRNSHTG